MALSILSVGLWLIPMGYLVLALEWMPRPLGWILMGGGVGYILSAFVVYLVPHAPGSVELALAMLATVGEFWMIGYLRALG